jgi:DNA-binding transcriptional ArsR family regulator
MRRHPAIDLFRILGVPQRVVVLQRVARRPSTASELAKELPISRSAIVQHLTLLREHGLVDVAREGRNSVYRPTPQGLLPLREWLERYS